MSGAGLAGPTGNGAAPTGGPPLIDKNIAEWLGIAPDAAYFTLKLQTPVEIGGQSYTEVTLRPPTVRQVEEAARENTGMGQDIVLISMLAKVPQTMIRDLPFHEFAKLKTFLNVFLLAGPPARGWTG